MTTSALRNLGTEIPEPGKSFNPGKTRISPDSEAPAWRKRIVESCLEGGFLPETRTLTSFLVNALYLFGDNAVVAYGGAPEGVTEELTRLGHRVTAGPWGREIRARRQGRHDRAVMLAQAFGRGEDSDIQEQLLNLRRALRPGGLLCFHVFDRDRAWNLAGERVAASEGRRAAVRVGFDPANGRISARLASTGPDGEAPDRGVSVGGAADGAETQGCGGFLAVKAWNRPEIEALLRGAGLRLERIYGDWNGDGQGSAATGRLIVVAAKPRRARRPSLPAGRSRA